MNLLKFTLQYLSVIGVLVTTQCSKVCFVSSLRHTKVFWAAKNHLRSVTSNRRAAPPLVRKKSHFPFFNSSLSNAHNTPPPLWILIGGELESTGQRLISSNIKSKRMEFQFHQCFCLGPDWGPRSIFMAQQVFFCLKIPEYFLIPLNNSSNWPYLP